MNRSRSLLLLAVAACGNGPAPRTGASGSSVAAVDAAPPDAHYYETENDRLVKEAFGGRAPAIPQLSRDGEVAAIDLSMPIGLSDSATYEVGFLRRTGKVDAVAVIDDALARELMHDDLSKVDRPALNRAATTIARRLADGGFAPFATAIDYDAIYRQVDASGAVALGGGKLEVKDDAELSLRLVDAAGKTRKSEVFEPHRAGTKAGGNCGGEPHLRAVWVDATQKRALLAITYTTGGDMCDEVRGTYRLWAL